MKSKIFAYCQKIGKALMLPIAVLPAAGLLLRLGQTDLLNIEMVVAAGDAVFKNLPIIFAMGIATGISKDGDGAATLAGAISYFVLTNAMKTIDETIDMSVFGGVVAGIVSGELYNRFYKMQLPEWLAFFGGRRFVPIVSVIAHLLLAVVLGFVWPTIQQGINSLGHAIQTMGPYGAGLYGLINRLLIPFGLHHILNSYFWFALGSFEDPVTHQIVTGDLTRFFAKDPTAGRYMAGFFPFMMFGYPAAVLAMYVSAKKANRKKVLGMFISIGLTIFLTGIGEPIDFIYMFIAPPLYLIHSILVGLSMMVTDLLGVKMGFSFSAGAIDYVLNFGIGTKSFLIIPIGLVLGAIYYAVFRFCIVKFNIPTPGREDDLFEEQTTTSNIDEVQKAQQIIDGLGGADNIIEVGACITRLRVRVKDTTNVKKEVFKKLGASGVLEVQDSVQIVFGTKAEMIKDSVAELLQKESTSR